jgi:hypothetical protein
MGRRAYAGASPALRLRCRDLERARRAGREVTDGDADRDAVAAGHGATQLQVIDEGVVPAERPDG